MSRSDFARHTQIDLGASCASARAVLLVALFAELLFGLRNCGAMYSTRPRKEKAKEERDIYGNTIDEEIELQGMSRERRAKHNREKLQQRLQAARTSRAACRCSSCSSCGPTPRGSSTR